MNRWQRVIVLAWLVLMVVSMAVPPVRQREPGEYHSSRGGVAIAPDRWVFIGYRPAWAYDTRIDIPRLVVQLVGLSLVCGVLFWLSAKKRPNHNG